MATNQYFNFYTNTEEQSLTNDLVVESLQIYGHDVRYLPREYTHVDDIFNEVKNSSFENEFTIEMYIQGVDGFGGDGDLLSKFGVEIRDTQTFIVANTRFAEEATTANIGYTIPRAGDLIYMPLTGQLMEIKHVEDEEVYYQLGKAYVTRLSTEFFEYSEETFETGVPEIDVVETSNQYTIQLTMGSGAGTFAVNEEVYQGTDLANFTAKAEVTDWNPTDLILTVRNINGNFNTGATVNGDTSGASYTLGVKETMVFPESTEADNKVYETNPDSVIDFSEDNPFSEDF
jgi:hypothetical protein